MSVLVIYESMFGSTREIAAAIASAWQDAELRAVRAADTTAVCRADVLIVGAPTHMFGLSRPRSRQMAGQMAAESNSGLTLEPGFDGPGVREWLNKVRSLPPFAAAFDPRAVNVPSVVGHAAPRIARALRRRGGTLLDEPAGFLVGKDQRLLEGEAERARAWGKRVLARWREATSRAARGG